MFARKNKFRQINSLVIFSSKTIAFTEFVRKSVRQVQLDYSFRIIFVKTTFLLFYVDFTEYF